MDEKYPCPLCGADHPILLTLDNRYHYECPKCGYPCRTMTINFRSAQRAWAEWKHRCELLREGKRYTFDNFMDSLRQADKF